MSKRTLSPCVQLKFIRHWRVKAMACRQVYVADLMGYSHHLDNRNYELDVLIDAGELVNRRHLYRNWQKPSTPTSAGRMKRDAWRNEQLFPRKGMLGLMERELFLGFIFAGIIFFADFEASSICNLHGDLILRISLIQWNLSKADTYGT